MTERENLIKVLNHNNPEWMPHAMDSLDLIAPNDFLGERPEITEGRGYDAFGVLWHWAEYPDNPSATGFSYVSGSEILEDITQWREVIKLPDISKLDWSKADAVAAQLDRENKLTALFWESGPFERVVSFMGFEGALVAMMTEPEEFYALMEFITDYKLSLIPLLKEHYDVDMICIFEDVAHHKAPFMSCESYREHIFPHNKRIADAIRENGMMYAYHSCGNITPLLDEILNLDPKLIVGGFAQSNNQELMEELYGDRVCFFGAFNLNLLGDESTSREQMIEETRRLIDTFKPHKNLIFGPFLSLPHLAQIATEEYQVYAKDIYKR